MTGTAGPPTKVALTLVIFKLLLRIIFESSSVLLYAVLSIV